MNAQVFCHLSLWPRQQKDRKTSCSKSVSYRASKTCLTKGGEGLRDEAQQSTTPSCPVKGFGPSSAAGGKMHQIISRLPTHRTDWFLKAHYHFLPNEGTSTPKFLYFDKHLVYLLTLSPKHTQSISQMQEPHDVTSITRLHAASHTLNIPG